MKKLLLIIGLCVLCLSQVNAKNVYADLNEDQTIGNGTWKLLLTHSSGRQILMHV